METEIFTLCDAAADYQGRLNILGVFDTIFAPKLPVSHPHCAVALRIRFSKIEEGKHALALHIVDSDGKMIIPPLEGGFEVHLVEDESEGAINLVLNLQGLIFNSYETYNVNLAIDSQKRDSLPFRVKQPA
jgi:hypothetical protein